MRSVLTICITLLTILPATVCQAGELDMRPLSERPYLGVVVRAHARTGGCLVYRVLPGPLQLTDFESPYLNPGDIITQVDGRKVDARAFTDLLASSKPGDTLTLTVMRTGSPGDIAPLEEEAQPIIQDLTVTVAPLDRWSGPLSFHPPRKPAPLSSPLPSDQTSLETFLYEHLDALGTRQTVDRLVAFFADTYDKTPGFHSLTRVAAGLRRPTVLPELQTLITQPLPGLADDPALLLRIVADNLDLVAPDLAAPIDLADPRTALALAAERLTRAHAKLDQAFAGIDADRRDALRRDLNDLLQWLASNKSVSSRRNPSGLLAAMRESMNVDFTALLAAAAEVAPFLAAREAPAGSFPPMALPEELADAVTGDILAVLHDNGRWLVYGGVGVNRYDMTVLDVVIDQGGSDLYRYDDAPRPSVQIIVDFAGNDNYVAQGVGPASAEFGVSVLVDCQGSDLYAGQDRSCGVGLMGIAVLLDRDGADEYLGASWSHGVGFYGAGAVIDLGDTADVYDAAILSEGVGGPRGFGLILDRAGNDLYRADSPVPSAFDTPGVFCGYSQGVGFGVRLYDSGGIGVLCDLAGDDRYIAGDFSQGGGCFRGLGVLNDRAGNDLYTASHYAQGFAYGQALGVLADDAGHDTYHAATPAAQGVARDIAAALLIDRAGNDSYQAGDQSQGSASMQASAWLIDLEGDDRYVASGPLSQGRSGPNTLHFEPSSCFSWSVLLDAGGSHDLYSTGRPENNVIATGDFNQAKPEESTLHGVFIDTPERRGFAPPSAPTAETTP